MAIYQQTNCVECRNLVGMIHGFVKMSGIPMGTPRKISWDGDEKPSVRPPCILGSVWPCLRVRLGVIFLYYAEFLRLCFHEIRVNFFRQDANFWKKGTLRGFYSRLYGSSKSGLGTARKSLGYKNETISLNRRLWTNDWIFKLSGCAYTFYY